MFSFLKSKPKEATHKSQSSFTFLTASEKALFIPRKKFWKPKLPKNATVMQSPASNYKHGHLKGLGGDYPKIGTAIEAFAHKYPSAALTLLAEPHGTCDLYQIGAALAAKGMVGAIWVESQHDAAAIDTAEAEPKTCESADHELACLKSMRDASGAKVTLFHNEVEITDCDFRYVDAKDKVERNYLLAIDQAYEASSSSGGQAKPGLLIMGMRHVIGGITIGEEINYLNDLVPGSYAGSFAVLEKKGGIALIPDPLNYYNGADNSNINSNKPDRYGMTGIEHGLVLLDQFGGDDEEKNPSQFQSYHPDAKYRSGGLQRIVAEDRLVQSFVAELELPSGVKGKYWVLSVAPPENPHFSIEESLRAAEEKRQEVLFRQFINDSNAIKSKDISGMDFSGRNETFSQLDLTGWKMDNVKWGGVRFDSSCVLPPEASAARLIGADLKSDSEIPALANSAVEPCGDEEKDPKVE